MPKSTIRFTSFPRTEPPPDFVPRLITAFRSCESAISTEKLDKGLTSDGVLPELSPALVELGFEVERGKHKADRIERPVARVPHPPS
jgi:hypothetical protein